MPHLAVRFAFYGWGNPPLPDSSDDIKEYLATLKAVEPVPQWLFDMLESPVGREG